MIKLIVGVKGTGKTKALVDEINKAANESHGSVVCVEYKRKLTYDINYRVRLADAGDYDVFGADKLYGFICGILAGIGGFVYFLHVGSGSPSHASGAEMNAIAASIIGGTMLTGGVGNIIGTFFGVLSLSTIKNIVSSLGLDEAWWTNITVAGMICLFLVIQSLVLSRKNKDS